MKVTGTKQAKEAFRKLEEGTQGRNMVTALRAGALTVSNDAKRRAPFLTGTLRRSIHTLLQEITKDTATIAIGTNLEYARRIEMGFSGVDSLGRSYDQPPNPYLRPALEENKARVEREVRQAFADLVRQVK